MSKQTDLINVTDAITVSGSNVGIGATSLGAGRGLTVANGAVAVTSANLSHSTSSLVLGQDSASISQIRFYGANTSTAGILQFTGSSSDGIVGGDRMRIDSSGNLLVGKTSAGYNVDGFEAHQNGETYVSRSGTPMAINRNSSDGTLLNFYKDGGGVGSIGSYTSLPYIGKSDVTLLFDPSGPHIIPRGTNGGARDAAINLGASTNRFKDLYLSGGIYLGGTGSANKLDDYEEGTWTPVDGSGQVTITGATGVYTRVGRQVTVLGAFTYPSTSQTNYAIIAGLPFSVSNAADAVYAPGSVQTSYISSTNRHLAPIVYRNTYTFYFYDSELPLTNAAFSTRNFRINITYFTDQ